MMRAFSIGMATALGLLATVPAVSAQTTMSRETTTTTTTTGPVTLAPDARTRVRQYVVQHRQPSVVVQDRVAIGTVLPPDAQFYSFEGLEGIGSYRYAYVNDAPVLVDPGSRRIIEVIEYVFRKKRSGHIGRSVRMFRHDLSTRITPVVGAGPLLRMPVTDAGHGAGASSSAIRNAMLSR
jgi:hypothetical protein